MNIFRLSTCSAALALAAMISAGCERNNPAQAPSRPLATDAFKDPDMDDIDKVNQMFPTSGQRIILKADFDYMMKQAPILDIKDPKFDRKSAEFWHETVAKLFLVGNDMTSSGFKDALNASDESRASDAASDEDVVKAFRARLATLQRLPENSKIDTFEKRFICRYMQDNFDIVLASAYTRSIFKSVGVTLDGINVNDPQTYRGILDKLSALPIQTRTDMLHQVREHEQKIRLIIYAPAPGPDDIIIRDDIWIFLSGTAEYLEHRCQPASASATCSDGTIKASIDRCRLFYSLKYGYEPHTLTLTY